MERRQDFEAARNAALNSTRDQEDRILELERVTSQFPEYIAAYSDIAKCYLEMGDKDSAVRVFESVLVNKKYFEDIWPNDLGLAYLFTNNLKKALTVFQSARKILLGWDLNFFLALTYLKLGNKAKFREEFDRWIQEDIEKSFRQESYHKYIQALFKEEAYQYINEIWDGYHLKYANMEPYALYSEAYQQNIKKHPNRSFWDGIYRKKIDPSEKLSAVQFQKLMDEYFQLDRKTLFGDAHPDEYKRLFELQDLLHTKVVLHADSYNA